MKKKLVWALLLCLVIAAVSSAATYAQEIPDVNRLGSITMTVRAANKPVEGGVLTAYRVCDVAEEDGRFFFRPIGGFVNCGESFESFSDTGMAERLKTYAHNNSIPGYAVAEIGEGGRVVFDNLPVGVYLIVQHENSDGGYYLTPFLVTLPYLTDGTYVYDLTAEPKSGLEVKIPEEQLPEDPGQEDSKLPQTGQLWWPVPLLLCGGLALLAAGIVITRRSRA